MSTTVENPNKNPPNVNKLSVATQRTITAAKVAAVVGALITLVGVVAMLGVFVTQAGPLTPAFNTVGGLVGRFSLKLASDPGVLTLFITSVSGAITFFSIVTYAISKKKASEVVKGNVPQQEELADIDQEKKKKKSNLD